MAGQQKPVHEIRMGRIKSTIWSNDTSNGQRYNVTFSRLYKADDKWEQSTSFGRDDLPLVMKVADQAHNWIFEQASSSTERDAA